MVTIQKILLTTTILILLSPVILFAQRRDVDFGFILGTMQYNGDVNMTKPFYSPQPCIGGIFRKNFNPHYSLRFGVTYGQLKADDWDFENSYQQNRSYYFDDTKILEFSSMVEFNFYEVTPNKKEKNFSPFVVGGLGVMYIEGLKWTEAFNIPLGLGLKYKLLPKLELRAEWTWRKTFTDGLDHLADKANDGYLQYKQISFSKTKDWFSVLGISLLFNFSDEKIPCPIYEGKSYGRYRKKH